MSYVSELITKHAKNIDAKLFEDFFCIWNEQFSNQGELMEATSIQEKCICDDFFWGNKNLIIQAPTASGKTFTGEILSAANFLKGYSTIYLVPLRSLVNEKYREFTERYVNTKTINKVFASSSDFQENDKQISNGKYNIAIMVYEKFLALRADSQSNILKNCRLIIVDELQMLSNNSRGDKLEAALTDILLTDNRIRIVGLTTNSCNMEYVSDWFNNAHIIKEDIRPTELDEYVISPSGKYWKSSSDNLNTTIHKGNLNDTTTLNYLPNQNEEKNKKELLKSIIEYKYMSIQNQENSANSKILVFFAGKEAVEELCGTVKNLFKNKMLERSSIKQHIESKREEFDKLCLDENEVGLFNRYFQYGVAYHHSGLSFELRKFIEDEIRNENGILNIIIATETLTVGLNMPFDTVIIYNLRIPDGANLTHDMYTYEYKNYIGRAGRKGKGESYLFAEYDNQIRMLYERYVSAKPAYINSCILEDNPLAFVPFLLGWLSGSERNGGISGQITVDSASQYINRTFLMHCVGNNKEYSICQQMLDFLCDSQLLERSIENNKQYGMLTSGRALAGYIYFPSTYSRIIKLVQDIENYVNEKEIDTIDKMDLEFEKIILAILYDICQYDDVISKGFFSREKILRSNSELQTFILDIVRERNSKMDIARFPFIKCIHYENFIEERFHSFAKAIMLWIWANGFNLSNNEYFPFSGIKTGEMQNLAELVAYILEGIAKQCASRENKIISDYFSRKLFDFAGCVQYGQRYEMKHVRKMLKISRGRITQIANTIKPSDTKDFIEYITCSDKVETDLREFAKQKLISTKELNALPYVTEELFNKYINSYDERSKNIQKYLNYSGIDSFKDNHDLFLEIIEYTSVFEKPINFIEADQSSINNEDSFKREFFYYPINGNGDEKYRIMLYYDHWSEEDEIENCDFEDFLKIAKNNKINCIIGPRLPFACIDQVNNTDILYMDKCAFLLACLYTYRLKESYKLRQIIEHNIGYIALGNINAVYGDTYEEKLLNKKDFFISYCKKDAMDILPEVLQHLESAGFTYWCDLTSKNNELDMDTYINKGIKICKYALIIGTKNYFTDMSSPHTTFRKKELSTIIKREMLCRILEIDNENKILYDDESIPIGTSDIPRIPVDRNNWSEVFEHMNFFDV